MIGPKFWLASGVALLAGVSSAQKSDVRLDVGDPPGAAFSSVPRVAASGDRVFVAWSDQRDGQADVYFQRSMDRGETWLPAGVRLDTDAAGSANSIQIGIATFGDTVYVVWSDFRNGGALSADLYLNVSTDGGQTWLPADVRVNQDPAGVAAARAPLICADAQNVYVAWVDDRSELFDIYFQRSADGGATWLPSDVLVNTNGAGNSISLSHSLACAAGVAGTVYVAWNDYRNGASDVYMNVSTDGGLTWGASDVRLDTDAAGAANSSYTDIAAEGSNVYVTWWDGRSGGEDIYLNYSTDRGATWQVNDIRLDTDPPGAGFSSWPDIAVDGDNVYVVWDERRVTVPASCPVGVFANFSNDGGQTWQSSDVQLNAGLACGATSFEFSYPQVVAENGAAFVVWTDPHAGLGDTHYNRSLDAGASWLGTSRRIESGTPGASFSGLPTVATGSEHVYVVWSDDRNGATDIYFNVPFGLHSYGPGKLGSGGFVPELRADGRATTGTPCTLSLDEVLGGAAGALLVGVPPRASLNLLDGTVLLAPAASFPIGVGGPVGVAGAGSSATPLSIPDVPALVGSGLLFQYLALDPGATFGISMSNGVEMRFG